MAGRIAATSETAARRNRRTPVAPEYTIPACERRRPIRYDVIGRERFEGKAYESVVMRKAL
jgi:hypothetical protein